MLLRDIGAARVGEHVALTWKSVNRVLWRNSSSMLGGVSPKTIAASEKAKQTLNKRRIKIREVSSETVSFDL